MPPATERLAPQQPPDPQPGSPQRTVPCDRLEGVLGAGRLEPADGGSRGRSSACRLRGATVRFEPRPKDPQTLHETPARARPTAHRHSLSVRSAPHPPRAPRTPHGGDGTAPAGAAGTESSIPRPRSAWTPSRRPEPPPLRAATQRPPRAAHRHGTLDRRRDGTRSPASNAPLSERRIGSDGEPFAAPSPPCAQDLAPILGPHPGPKAMGLLAAPVVRLVGSLHQSPTPSTPSCGQYLTGAPLSSRPPGGAR